ncbi:GIY-YIG nuclease family protein [Mycolicibacterium fortuitum]|uniref:GIY-YIG nuclease family protein n=1 Tax=Mycolicibacterium fortuitum TaxID=1766 RepID=UPI0026263773|nr:GIY-YIG nuclease family protein [Mycolicibacterium fortuitum]
MSLGFTAPPLTKDQREAKRLAKLEAFYGVCKTGGHLMGPGNVHCHEDRVYCRTCVEAGTVTPASRRWVYFIADGAGHVKIGYAVNVAARLAELQCGNVLPLKVLAILKGGCEAERALHERFAEHRVRGEWFRLAPEILDYIASLPKLKNKGAVTI